MEYAYEGMDTYRGGICIIFTFVCYCSNASVAYIFSTELLFVMKIYAAFLGSLVYYSVLSDKRTAVSVFALTKARECFCVTFLSLISRAITKPL
jgi:hypothetical protein